VDNNRRARTTGHTRNGGLIARTAPPAAAGKIAGCAQIIRLSEILDTAEADGGAAALWSEVHSLGRPRGVGAGKP